MHKLGRLQINDKVFFKDEPKEFIVRAKGGKYLIATSEGTAEKYTIIDAGKGICGPHDRTFNPYNFKKQEDIDKCLSDLVAGEYGIALSRRHSAPIEDVIDVERTIAKRKYLPVKVCLHKTGTHTLERDGSGQWFLDKKEIEQERAIAELLEAVRDLGYWCQVAKDVLPAEQFEMVQEAYAYEED